MIDTHTGDYRMISFADVPRTLAAGKLVMQGTEDEIRAVSQRIKLGVREQQNRAQRRKQQRTSRRRNR